MTTSKEHLYPNLPVLLVDDEPAWLRSLVLTLREAAGINNVIRCTDSREVADILLNNRVSLILLDLTMPHFSGEELLEMIARDHSAIPVIVLTGMNQVDSAVRCMQLGAFDYFVKTTEKERLISGIRRAFALQELRRENSKIKERLLEDCLEHPEAFSKISTQSRKMRAVLQYCEAVVASSEPILLTGESGCGKELVAQAIRQIRSPEGPWVAVNVAGLDDNVFSDTLFGHVRGAFTNAENERPGMIEKAAGGTLFLDEIGDLNPSSQIKLLRLLQEREFYPLGSDNPKKLRAKLVFATNHCLEYDVKYGNFRKDLYYRLNAHHVAIPPLRERLEDLPLLVDALLEEAATAMSKKKPTAPPELITLLSTYHFPGNIRELRAMVFDAVSLHKAHKLSLDSFKKNMGLQLKDAEHIDIPSTLDSEQIDPLAFNERLPTLDEAGQLVVAEAMRRAEGNQSLAASLLGISRQALSKRLKKTDPSI